MLFSFFLGMRIFIRPNICKGRELLSVSKQIHNLTFAANTKIRAIQRVIFGSNLEL